MRVRFVCAAIAIQALFLVTARANVTIRLNDKPAIVVDVPGYMIVIKGSPDYKALGNLASTEQIFMLPKKVGGDSYSRQEIRESGFIHFTPIQGVLSSHDEAMLRSHLLEASTSSSGKNETILEDNDRMFLSYRIFPATGKDFNKVVQASGFIVVNNALITMVANRPLRADGGIDVLKKALVDWADQMQKVNSAH